MSQLGDLIRVCRFQRLVAAVCLCPLGGVSSYMTCADFKGPSCCGSSYQLSVEFCETRLALAVEDQKGADHGGWYNDECFGLCARIELLLRYLHKWREAWTTIIVGLIVGGVLQVASSGTVWCGGVPGRGSAGTLSRARSCRGANRTMTILVYSA